MSEIVRGHVGLECGDVVLVGGEMHEFIRAGCATNATFCDRKVPVTLRRIKPDGSVTLTQCFESMEIIQPTRETPHAHTSE